MAVAVRVESPNIETVVAVDEVYAQSLRNFRVMGSLACKGLLETPEYQGAYAERWADFYTGVAENLATDPDYGEQLYFSPMESRCIIDGHVVDKAGKPIREVVKDGLEASRKAAVSEPEMLIQAERDEGDVEIIEIVDNLKVGEAYAIVSMDPKEELRRDPKFWKNKMSYRDGMAVLQVYYKVSETELLTGNYAVKRSNLAAFREIFGKREAEIPENESPNRYSRYGILQSMSQEEALGLGPKLVKEHRQIIGDQVSMVSATEIVYENISLLEKYFNAYLVPMSKALSSEKNDPALQSFTTTLLQKGTSFSPELRRKLIKISNSNNFSSDDARLIEEKVRYAVLEELRKFVPAKLMIPLQQEQRVATLLDVPQVPVIQNYTLLETQALSQRAASNIADGLSAKRSYGGCSGAGETDPSDPLSDLTDSQKALRGIDKSTLDNPENKENWKWKKGVCRVDKCPTRPGETEVGPCEVCRSCQRWFDKGRDPFKLYSGLRTATKTTVKKSGTHKQTIFTFKAKENE